MKTVTFDPAQWRLVPVEPTEEMEQAAADHLDACVKAHGLWVTMLEAAPEAPVSVSEPGEPQRKAVRLYLGMIGMQKNVGACKQLAQDAIDALERWDAVARAAAPQAPEPVTTDEETAWSRYNGDQEWGYEPIAKGLFIDGFRAALTAPHTAQAEHQPLTDAQMKEGLDSYEWESVPHPFRTSVSFERGVRFAERAHGIVPPPEGPAA